MQIEIIGLNRQENTLNCFIEDDNGNILEIKKVPIPDFLEIKFTGRENSVG